MIDLKKFLDDKQAKSDVHAEALRLLREWEALNRAATPGAVDPASLSPAKELIAIRDALGLQPAQFAALRQKHLRHEPGVDDTHYYLDVPRCGKFHAVTVEVGPGVLALFRNLLAWAGSKTAPHSGPEMPLVRAGPESPEKGMTARMIRYHLSKGRT